MIFIDGTPGKRMDRGARQVFERFEHPHTQERHHAEHP